MDLSFLSVKKKVISMFVAREISKCKKNPEYFLENYCKILTELDGPQPFKLYDFQRHKCIRQFLRHKRVVIVKSRQTGVSTIVAGYILWNMIFRDFFSSLVISKDKEASQGFIKKTKLILTYMPYWLHPKQTVENKQSIELTNGSYIQAFASSTESGRSFAAKLLIFDEGSFIREASSIWRASQPTLSKTQGSFVVLSCVTEDTRIFTKDGIFEIKELINKEKENGYLIDDYEVAGCLTTRNGNLLFNNGCVDTLKINTPIVSVEGSLNHKLWSYSNGKYDWHKLEDLRESDWVAIQYGANLFGNYENIDGYNNDSHKRTKFKYDFKKITPDLAYLFGLYISEGSCYKNKNNTGCMITISCGDDATPLFEKLGIKCNKYDNVHHCISSLDLMMLFEYVGFDLSKKASQKEIPINLMKMNKENTIALLQGLFDGDGYSDAVRGRVGYSSTSEKLIDQVHMLLLNLGLWAKKNKKTKERSNSYESLKNKFNYDQYVLELNSYNGKLFYEKIGFRFERKQNKKNVFDRKIPRNADVIPTQKELLKELLNYSKLKRHNLRFDHDIRFDSGINVERTIKLFNLAKINMAKERVEEVEKILLPNTKWIQINSIEKSKNYTYDFSLPNDENDFWAHSVLYNGLIGHQTPSGRSGFFADKYFGAPENGFHAEKIMWDEMPDRDETWKEAQIKDLGQKAFDQEFCCDFQQSGGTVIEAKDIEWIEKECLKDPINMINVTNKKNHTLNKEREMWIWESPEENRNYIVSCLPEGEFVKTDHGLKQIQDVKITDKLFGQNGKYTEIWNIQKREYNGDIYDIKLSNTIDSVKFTKEHPILISKSNLLRNYNRNHEKYRFNERYWDFDFKWKNAGDIEVGDWVCYPNVYKNLKILENADIVGQFDKCQKNIRKDFVIDKNIALNEDFWWYVGMWLAEGWTGQDKYGNLSCQTAHHILEKDIKNKIFNISRDLFKRKCLTTDFPHMNASKCQFSSKTMGLFLTNNFKKYAKNKIIPEWVKLLPNNLKLNLVKGYFEGDGCVTKTKRGNNICLVSSSKNLLISIQEILFSFGIISSWSILKARNSMIMGRILRGGIRYSLNLGRFDTNKLLNMFGENNNNLNNLKNNRIISNCFLSKDENYIYFKIKDIDIIKDYSGLVYNFSTDSHTFLCQSITTHNCDTARGDGEDYSAFSVFKLPTLLEKNNKVYQVAEFKGKVKTDILGEMLDIIGREYNDAICIVENNNMGIATLNELVRIDYPNLYYTDKGAKQISIWENINIQTVNSVPGFTTSVANRGKLIPNSLDKAIRQKTLIMRSKRFVNECWSWLWIDGKAIHDDGCNDDLMMSTAIFTHLYETSLEDQALNQEKFEMITNVILDNREGKVKDFEILKNRLQLREAKNPWIFQYQESNKGDDGDWDLRELL